MNHSHLAVDRDGSKLTQQLSRERYSRLCTNPVHVEFSETWSTSSGFHQYSIQYTGTHDHGLRLHHTSNISLRWDD